MINIDFAKELDDRAIYIQSFDNKIFVIECKRMEDGNLNSITSRIKICRNISKALEVVEEWAGTS